MKLPDYFVDRIQLLFPEEAEGYFNSFNMPPHYGLRTNTLKISPSGLEKLLNIPLEPVAWCDNGFYYNADYRPAKSPLYHAGLFYIQEPSAMAPASVFDIKKGDKVLDLCSAPGGKTTQLAAKLDGEGLIVANDVSNTRLRGLVKNIEMAGVTNGVVLNETPQRLANIFPEYFDKVLIDAPCSGEGMFRKDSEAVKNYEKHKSEQCSVIQKDILQYADKMLKPGGKIMYSTCTFAPEENEMIIGGFIDSNPNYEIAEIDHQKYGLSNGYPRFYKDYQRLGNTARLWPHKARAEGHFMACIIKKEGIGEYYESDSKNKGQDKGPDISPNIKYFHDFCRENLRVDFSEKEFLVHGDSLYIVPEGLPSFKGIRVMRSGWHVGEFKKNRFEPSQAFAMGIKAEDYEKSRLINLSQTESLRYLRGDSFEVESADGYGLVCVEGFPLGFGKVKDGRMKNKYLKSWIMN